MTKRELIADMGYEDAVVFDSPDYDDAIIGVSEDGRVVYNYDAMVECLTEQDDMNEEEAREFIDYNAIRSLQYQHDAPIVMYPLPEEN